MGRDGKAEAGRRRRLELAIRLLRIALVETSQPYAKPSQQLLLRLAADEEYRRKRRRVKRK